MGAYRIFSSLYIVFIEYYSKTCGVSGKLLSETINYPGFSKNFSYDYPNNWEQSFTGPDGVTVTAAYDESQRLQEISIPGLNDSIQYSDYEWRRPQTITLPGNNTINRSYDALQRTTGINAIGGRMQRSYDYSTVGNILTKVTEHGTYTYDYDALSRLTDATNPSPDINDEHFTYDKLGNRLTDDAVPGGMAYNKNNEMSRIGTVNPVYNENGHMTEKPWSTTSTTPQKYVYDATNRLKEIKDYNQNNVAEYYYDPFGRRLWKETPSGGRTYFMYAKEGLIAEFDSSGNEICSYGYVPGSTWTTNPLYQRRNGNYYWYLNDHIGTPQKMIDNSGNVVWAARYDSFGNTIIDTETVENNLRFSGQYFDEESGLHYNWNRYYDPFLGRYLQTDPLGLDAGINLFVYANLNPICIVDPRGLEGRFEDGSAPTWYMSQGLGGSGKPAGATVSGFLKENRINAANNISKSLRYRGVADRKTAELRKLFRILAKQAGSNKGDGDDSRSRKEKTVNEQIAYDKELLNLEPVAIGIGSDKEYYVGRDGSISLPFGLELDTTPNQGIFGFIEDYVPFGHNFGKYHDYMNRNLNEIGIPDEIHNIVTMPLAFTVAAAVTAFEIVANIIEDVFFEDYEEQEYYENFEY